MGSMTTEVAPLVEASVDADTHLLNAEALVALGETNNRADAAVYARVVLHSTHMPTNAVEAYVGHDLTDVRFDESVMRQTTPKDRELRIAEYRAETVLRLACDATVGFWASPRLNPEQAAHILQTALEVATKITGDSARMSDELHELVDWMWASNLRHRQRGETVNNAPQFTVSPEHALKIAEVMGITLTPEATILAEREQRIRALAERSLAQQSGGHRK